VNALVPITLFGWLPLVITSFLFLPPRKAVITAYITAWLFLPVASFDVPGFVDYDKTTATNIGVLLGVLFFDSARLRALRWRWFDLGVLVFCCSPFLSSLSNGLGAYDGFSASLSKVIAWGSPYVVGRMYFADGPGLEALAYGVFAGGVIYAPLCLWEIRMSPQLHYQLYGFSQHAFDQTMRGGGFRPVVFMQHGLAVGLWMASASLVGLTLWLASRRQLFLELPMYFLAPVVFVTTVLCKSSGATLLMLVGLGVVWWTRRRLSKLALYAMMIVPVVYIPVRTTNLWSGRPAVEFIADFSAERAQSLEFRLESEDLLSAKARQRWMLGWGGWGRNTVLRDEEAGLEAITDGMWILVFGQQGALGLIGFLVMLLAPIHAFLRACPRAMWRHPRVAPLIALATVLAAYSIDNLLNNMLNPVFLLIAGGIGAVKFAAPKPQGATH